MAETALKLDHRTLGLLGLQWTLFWGNFALYWFSPLPLWLHVSLGVVAIHLAFTIWHEAAHGTISNRRSINNAAGIMGMFPYMTPYFMQRFVHLDHHKYLNEADKDPNQVYSSGPFWQLPIRYFRAIAYAKKMLSTDPRSRAMRFSDTTLLIAIGVLFIVSLWQGFFMDLFWLWLLPLAIAKIIMDWYVNFLPHVGLPPDRFLGTRIIDIPFLTPWVLCHNYHAVHHLWPSIPWHSYIARYRDKIDYLNEHRVPIETRLWTKRPSPPLAVNPNRDAGPIGRE
jgi:fatty acid desaturase